MEFIKEIKKPSSIISFVLFMISVALAITLYISNTKSSEISYCIEPTTKIVDSKLKGSKIRVYDDSNKEIKSDIYSTSVIIWNSGDLPINTEDIRIIPSIRFSGISQLLSIPTIKESKPNISEFRLIKDSIKSKTFELIWKHFDPNKAFRINILYTIKNENKYDVIINGNILGINRFQKVEYDPKDNKTFNIISIVGSILIALFFTSYVFLDSFIGLFRNSSLKILKHLAAKAKCYKVILLILSFIGMNMFIYAYILFQPDIPVF